MSRIVTWNLGDMKYEYYSEVAWEAQLTSWLKELGNVAEGLTTSDADEIIDLKYGGYLLYTYEE